MARIAAGTARRTMAMVASLGVAVGAATMGASPAGAASSSWTVQATGATITRTDTGASTALVVKAAAARLDLWCTSGKLVVNKVATTIPCSRLASVKTTGLTGNDTVSINATGFGTGVPATFLTVLTGAGNDTITVRHHVRLTVAAGAGNDTVSAGLGMGTQVVNETLAGDDGNDRLVNLGFIGANPVPTDVGHVSASGAVASTLVGGPGADVLVGDATRWTNAWLGSPDAVDLHGGPGIVSAGELPATGSTFDYFAMGGAASNPETLVYRSATSLTVGCAPSAAGGRAVTVVNGQRIGVPCALHPLSVIGTARADRFTYDQALANSPDPNGLVLQVALADGDDVALVNHPYGQVTVDGGAGNDQLRYGVHNGLLDAANASDTRLLGGPGNDVLANLSYLDPFPVNPDPHGGDAPLTDTAHFDGGPGADRFSTAEGFSRVWVRGEMTDDYTALPGMVALTLTFTDDAGGVDGRDEVTVHNDGALGTTILASSFTSSTRRLVLTGWIQTLELDLAGGDDRLWLDGAEPRSSLHLVGGTGTDALTIGLQWPTTWLPQQRLAYTDPGRPISYDADWERVAVNQPA